VLIRPAARRSQPFFLVATLALALTISALLVMPTLAAAQIYVVDSTADAELAVPGTDCETAAAECTLRAAIEASNEDADADAIEFDETVFEGEAGLDAIETATGLPAVGQPLEIDGGSCTTSAGPSGPCVEVVATTAQNLFVVAAKDTTIRNLAIGGATIGILVAGGEEFTAAGNWLGLALDENRSENNTGILVEAGSDHALVGGSTAADANYVASGEEGIVAEAASGFRAIGNVIGRGPDGGENPDFRPTRFGVYVASSALLDELPEVAENSMLIDVDATGIVSAGAGASIVENDIAGPLVGIETLEPSEGEGNLIEGNEIEAADRFGIRIENELNTVLGNTILASGWDGILLEGVEADHNQIGGDLPAEENVISTSSGNGGNAIEIETSVAASRNEIAANRGAENEGRFISLSGHANGDIQPPAIASALQTGASGTGAEPNATIRLFRKQTTAAGEIAAFLGKATADGVGTWKATFATSVPVGALVAATQTSSDGGTSEVSVPVSAAGDPVTPSCATVPALCPPPTGSVVPPPPPLVSPKPLKCKKGFAKKKVKGKPKCVKAKKKHKGKKGKGGKRTAAASGLFSF